MNRMTGLILMITGTLIFITGILFYVSSKKQALQNQNVIELEKPAEVNINQPVIIEMDNELDNAIQMAIADGVLTKNERDIIRKIVEQKGLDFDEVIKDVEQQINDSEMETETELVDYNKKQGNDFEKFVVQKFDKKYFTIKEWAGDKYINGSFAESTTNPDLLLELKVKEETAQFSVECKWRHSVNGTGFQFAYDNQFKRYKKYEKVKNIPVFIAIGIGGKGYSPEHFYIVPLRLLSSNIIFKQTLIKYEKKLDKDFFFDMNKNELR